MKRIVIGLLLWMCAAGAAWAQGGGNAPLMIEHPNCPTALRYGKAEVCYDTTQHAWFYWSDAQNGFLALPNLANAGPINSLPPQTAKYFAHNQGFGQLPCPGATADALVEGCAIGQFLPSTAVFSALKLTNVLGVANQGLQADVNGNITGTGQAAGSGALPAFGNPGFGLFENSAGAAAQWAACAGDVTCSAVTPGSYTVTKIQGNPVLSGTPGGDAYFYVWNQSQAQFVAVPASGDVTMTNSGRFTVTKVNGSSVGPFATQQVPCTVAQGCTGTTATQTGILRGGNPIAGSELSGDVTTSGSNATTVVSSHFAAPVPILQGGTGSTTAGGTAGTGLSVSGTFPTQQYALQTPVATTNGGRGCGVPVIFANLPGSPHLGDFCGVTDSSVGCIAGTPVTAGGGATFCLVTWDGVDWEPAGAATVPATGGGFSTAGTGLTSSGSTVSLLTPVAVNLGGLGADLSAATGILRAGNPITSSTVRAADTDNSIAHTGVDINTSHQVTNTHLANALPLNQGGTGCNATTFATLPVTPAAGTTCSITDANNCAVGSVISSGGGVTIPECTIRWNGSSWIASDVTATNPLTIGVAVTASNGIKTSAVTNTLPNAATSALLNDINNSETVAAADAANDGNDIDIAGTDMANQVHFGGGGASAVTFDNSALVAQGSLTSGAYQDAAITNTSFMGGTDSCSQNVHNYLLTSNSTITVSCMGMNNQRLTYYIQQPSSGATFTYVFAANGGSQILGDTPTACNLNSCIDEVTVDWIPSSGPSGTYIVNLVKSNITGGTTVATTCPVNQTCYYFTSATDSPAGNDANACTMAAPCATISKAQTFLSGLHPGDELLFKGGQTWTGTGDQPGSLNPSFMLGDSVAHEVNGSAAKPILITTYGNPTNALIDAANLNNFCIAHSGTTGPTNQSVSYVTISKFDCKRALLKGIVIHDGAGVADPAFRGIVLSNNNVYDTGPGCSAHNNTPCVGSDSPDWVSGATHTNDDTINPSTNNLGGFNYHQTTASCTSNSIPTVPTFNQAPFTTTTEASGTCAWFNTGVTGVYKNQLEFQEDGVIPKGVHITNNSVKWTGGHNCLEIHYDTGQVLAQGNTVGPGCVHEYFDMKGPGNGAAAGTTTEAIGGVNLLPGNVAQVLQNIVDGGYASGLSTGGAQSAFYIQNTDPHASDVLYQLNTVYDVGNGGACFQLTPNAPGCTSGQACAIVARIYNNNCYTNTTTPTGGAFGVFDAPGAGVGNIGNSTLDVENNILDGGGTNNISVTSSSVVSSNTIAGSVTKEGNNVIGGAVTSPGCSWRGGACPGIAALTDFHNTDPLYQCDINSSCGTFTTLPNYSLQSNSPVIGKGKSGLTTGNGNMGAY